MLIYIDFKKSLKYTTKNLIFFILTLVLSLYNPPQAQASVIFSDSFIGGYNSSLWTIYPGQFAPISSPFGITVNPVNAGGYSSLVFSGTLPSDLIIKLDMRINASPASDMGIFINNSLTGIWKNAYIFGLGYGGTPNSLLLRESNNPTSATGSWNYSIGVHHIELHISSATNTPITLIEDGDILLNWSSSNGFVIDRTILSLFGTGSEFANFQLCDSLGCDVSSTTPTPTPTPTATPSPTPSDTPTPTPTETPTPTNSPTSTPTPTPIPVSKVVLVPGLAGSWNEDALTKCKDSSYLGEWSAWAKSDEVYSPFLQSVQREGLTPLPFYYDWRRDPRVSAQALKTFIDTHTAHNERIYLVGHSLGGLVARAYLEQENTNAKVDRYVSVGSPHQGTPTAYYAWSGGKLVGDKEWRIGGALLFAFCQIHGNTGLPRQIIQQHAPVVQSLLPTYEYLRDKSTNQFKPVDSLIAQNTWLPNTHFPQPFFDVGIGSLAGIGKNTITEIIVSKPKRIDILLGNWVDGAPVKNIKTHDGDTVIIKTSALIPGSQTDTIEHNHGGLISSRAGISRIFFLLGLPEPIFPVLSTLQPSPTDALLIIGDAKRLNLEDPVGRTLTSDTGVLYVPNLSDGNFTLDIYPKGKAVTITLIQILSGDVTLWRSYDLKGSDRIRRKVRFSRQTPSVDLLQL